MPRRVQSLGLDVSIAIHRAVLLVVLVALSCRSVAAQQAGLVAAYAFDEGQGSIVVDFSTNNNGGVVNGATWTVGRYGRALFFNGIDASVVASSYKETRANPSVISWVMV